MRVGWNEASVVREGKEKDMMSCDSMNDDWLQTHMHKSTSTQQQTAAPASNPAVGTTEPVMHTNSITCMQRICGEADGECDGTIASRDTNAMMCECMLCVYVCGWQLDDVLGCSYLMLVVHLFSSRTPLVDDASHPRINMTSTFGMRHSNNTHTHTHTAHDSDRWMP